MVGMRSHMTVNPTQTRDDIWVLNPFLQVTFLSLRKAGVI